MVQHTQRRGAISLSAGEIAEKIWLAIADRKLRPGTRLKEEELAEIFKASRARVRQALASLERDGLVTISPNRGASVSAPSVSDARDVFYARKAIEARIMERLAATIEPSVIEDLRAHIERERVAALTDDTANLIRLSGGFHLALADHLGSEFLSTTLRDLIARTSLISAVYRDSAHFDCGPDEHEEIVTALQERDGRRASDLMSAHLEHIEQDLALDERGLIAHDLKQVFRVLS